MEKYLISLLEQNNRVIVPDLGAFIIRQNEPKDLVFNDLLAFDDGMLTDKIMLEDNILKAEAQSRIKQFVEKARRILETGETFPLEDIGFLRMDASSRIEFLSNTADPEQEKKETKKPEKEVEDLPEETLGDTEHSDYEAEYLKLMSSGKKSKKSKATVKEPEEEKKEPESKEKKPEENAAAGETEDAAAPEAVAPDTEAAEAQDTASPEAETSETIAAEAEEPDAEVSESEISEAEVPEVEVPEVEPLIENPAAETKAPESDKPKAKKGKTKAKKIVKPEDEDGFILADGDSEIEVDATNEDAPLQPDNEESIFQIDEDGEKSEVEEIEDRFRDAIAEEGTDNPEELTDETTADSSEEKLKAEPEPEPETEPVELKESETVTESEQEPEKETALSAVDQVRASEEARAIAEERAAMLAARQEKRQEEKPVSTYTRSEDRKKKTWPRILGFAALIIFILAVGWFMFPDFVNNLLTRDEAKITLEDQSSEANDQPVSETQEDVVPVESQVTSRETPVTSPEPAKDETASDQSELEVVQQAEEEPEPLQVNRPAGKQYHIVAGSFANLSNAEKFVRNLRDQGFDASIIGKRNNLHTVCFSSHPTKNAAEDELARIRINNDAQAWLLYY